jgi:hypothetical protein
MISGGARAIFLGLAIGVLANAPAWGEDRPAFKRLRADEDWSSLCDPAKRTEALDTIKCVPLSATGESWLSLGGELRERYEYTHNPTWGDDPQDKQGVFLQRYVLHADLHVTPYVRGFLQFYSALESGRAGAPSTLDENELDVQQAFIDLRLPLGGDSALTLRPGRQELRYGSGRIIDVREGPNVRRKFDGARAMLEAGGWQIDGLAVQPTVLQTGGFDDRIDDRQQLWGVYAAGRPAWLPGQSLDLYYLGFRDESARYDQGRADEHRHSVGAHLAGAKGGWDWDVEALYQFGSFGAGNIRAWTAASTGGYRFAQARFQPRVGLSADIASGDRDPNDADLETFNPLFPRGSYFSELALLGPRNFYDVHPSLTLELADDVSLVTDWNFFWRQSTKDGVYNPGGQLLRSGAGSSARFVGHSPSVALEWRATSRLTFTGIYSHFFPGQFIEDTGPSKDIDFIELTLKAVF